MTTDLDSIIRVTATIEPSPASARTFGRTLFAYTGDASGTSRVAIAGARARDLRVNRYDGIAAVAEEYATAHVVYEAAAAYFKQVPYPRDLLTVGWHETGAKSYVLGETGLSTATQLTDIKNVGSSTFTIAGQDVTVDLNVSGTGDTGFAAVATELQTEIRTVSSPDLSSVVVSYDTTADAYLIDIPIGVDIGGLPSGEAAEAVGLGADGAYYAGVAAETAISATLDRARNEDDSWYWIVLDPALSNSATSETVATWASTQAKSAFFDATGTGALVAAETTSQAYDLFDLGYDRTDIIWSNTLDYKAVQCAAVFAGWNPDGSGELPTLFGKELEDAKPDVLSSAQRAELERKRINYYTTVGGDDIVRQGVTVDADYWIDTRVWIDWFIKRVQDDVFGLLKGSPRVPLTERGVGQIQSVIEAACEVGRDNGGIAPGTVTETTANEIRRATGGDFNGTLSRGYLVQVGSVSAQPQVDREARKAPPINVWLKGSGAVHSLDIALSFTQ